jgi:hypothetical protein
MRDQIAPFLFGLLCMAVFTLWLVDDEPTARNPHHLSE